MLSERVIPCLLLSDRGLVKTVRFRAPSYVGDPINTVRIFNEKAVDELLLLDIEASRLGREPDYGCIGEIADEAFMPIAYGGGIRTLDQAQRLIGLGVEKVVVNSATLPGWDLVRVVSERFGSQAVVVAIDVCRDRRGRYRVYNATTRRSTTVNVVEHARAAVQAGAGEIFTNDVVRDGTGRGYDLTLVRKIAESVPVPFIVCGGAGTLDHLRSAAEAGASAVAAGSMFVYIGRHRAVLINYPEYDVLQRLFRND